jgi:hypothetical protein
MVTTQRIPNFALELSRFAAHAMHFPELKNSQAISEDLEGYARLLRHPDYMRYLGKGHGDRAMIDDSPERVAWYNQVWGTLCSDA